MTMDSCTNVLSQCPTGYQSQPAIVWLFDDTSVTNLFCLRKPEVFNPYNYKEYYVSPANPPQSKGSGSVSDPFLSLYFAFTEFYATFTKIILSAGEFYYQIDMQLIAPLIPNKYDPLNINSFLEFYELWIIGDPISYSVVYWKEQLTISSKAYKTFIKDIIFKGDLILRNNCTGALDYCYYCPTLFISDSSITTDQGIEITLDEYYNIPNNCSSYSDHTLFSFTSPAFFENIEFSGFRHQFNSLISSVASLNLTNVTFSRMQPKPDGSVITLVCLYKCEESNFGFINGLVTDLNYGYEHSPHIQVGSFFSSYENNSSYFEGVSFTYNFALSYLESAYQAHIINIQDSIGEITILDCLFFANYVNSLIIIDQSTLLYENLKPNAYNISQAYSQMHFTLSNTNFSQIYSSLDFITYLMRRTVHNFYISSVSIDNSYSGESGIIFIENSGSHSSKDLIYGEITVIKDQWNNKILIPLRTMTIDGLYIDSCSSGSTILNIEAIPVVNITGLIISNIQDANITGMSAVIQIFINAGKYLSEIPNTQLINSMDCTSITSITNLYNFYLETLTIFNTSCNMHSGSAGLLLNTVFGDSIITNILMHDINTTSNIGNAISISNFLANLSMSSISLYNILNLNGGIFELISVQFLTIDFIEGNELFSGTDSPMSIKEFNTLYLSSISMSSVGSYRGNGGALHIIASEYEESIIIISGGIFSKANAYRGIGGGLNLDSIAPFSWQYIYMENVLFTECCSMDGAALCVSERIGLISGSQFKNIQVVNSNSLSNGVISDYHYLGTLTITNLYMSGNRGLHAGVYGQYPLQIATNFNLDLLRLSISHLSITNSYSEGPVLNFISQDPSFFIQLNDITIQGIMNLSNTFADSIALITIGCIVNDIKIANMNRAITASFNSTMIINNGKFTSLSGIFAKMTEEVTFNCTNCIVQGVDNSLIIADTNCSVNLVNSQFTGIVGMFATLNNGVNLSLAQCDVSYVGGSLIWVQFSSTINIYDSVFANISGYFAKINNDVAFICDFCDVSYVENSLILADSGTYVILNNSNFYNNKVLNSVGPLISITSGHPSYFGNTTFIANVPVSTGVFYFSDTTVTIDSCIFRKNFAAGAGFPEIYGFTTYLRITNSVFSDHISSLDGGFLYILGASSVFINSTSFTRGYATSGGVILISASTLAVDSCTFEENTGAVSGGSICALSSAIKVSNSTFNLGSSSLGDAIYAESANVSISHSKFTGSQTTVSTPTSSVYILGSEFIDIDACSFTSPINNVSGLITVGCKTIDIVDSLFEKLVGSVYGGLSCTGNSSGGIVNIARTNFLRNYSFAQGGGVFIQDLSMIMTDCIVSLNYAGYNGGGMNLATPNCRTCVFNITNTNITNNTCNNAGGGIKWTNYKPNFTNVKFANNTANYGKNLASVPFSIVPINRRFLGDAPNFIIFNAVPGQNYTGVLNISLFDTYGNIILTDNSSILIIQAIPTYLDLTLKGNNTFTSTQGVFSVTDFLPIGPPGSMQMFVATTTAITGVANDQSTYSSSATIAIFLRNCTFGEEFYTTSCTPCPPNSYLIAPASACNICPIGGICPGGDMILPLPGYWRSTPISEIIYQCPVSQACLGDSTIYNYNGTCDTGFYGILCNSCIEGYSKASSGNCNICPKESINIFILLSIIIIVFLVGYILVQSSVNSALSPKSRFSIYIKIFTNYLHLLFLTAQFELNWPSYMTYLLNAQKQPIDGMNYIFSTDCYIASGDPVNTYYYRLILMSLKPIMIFGLSFAVWVTVCWFKDNYAQLKREFFLTMIIIYMLIYPNISIVAFSHFACQTIDQLGLHLKVNYEIQCWDRRYTKFNFSVVIPSITLWVIGLPAIILIIMTKRKKYLNQVNNRIIFGYIFNGYRRERYFWEFVIIYRKSIIISIVVFFSEIYSVHIQALSIFIILSGFTFIHYRLEPYTASELNHMELQSLLVSTLTLYCGLFYLTDTISNFFQLFLFSLIIIGNAYFLSLWIYWMVQALIDVIIKLSPHLKYYLRRGDAYDEEFFQEKIIMPGSYFEKGDNDRLYTFLKHPVEISKGRPFNISTISQLFVRILEEEYFEKKEKTDREYEKHNTILEVNESIEESSEIDDSVFSEIQRHPRSFTYHERLIDKHYEEVYTEEKETEQNLEITFTEPFLSKPTSDCEVLFFKEPVIFDIESQIDDKETQ